jgi:hypothetical protein
MLTMLVEKYRPIGVSTGDAKAHCAREVKPKPLPEFSGDRCDGHCDVEVLFAWWPVGFREWLASDLGDAKQRQMRHDYLSDAVSAPVPSLWPLLAFISLLLAARLADAPPIYQSYKLPNCSP